MVLLSNEIDCHLGNNILLNRVRTDTFVVKEHGSIANEASRRF